jgi:hypothetical protein
MLNDNFPVPDAAETNRSQPAYPNGTPPQDALPATDPIDAHKLRLVPRKSECNHSAKPKTRQKAADTMIPRHFAAKDDSIRQTKQSCSTAELSPDQQIPEAYLPLRC